MGFYAEKVLPRIVNAACGMKGNEPIHERICAVSTGECWRSASGRGATCPTIPPPWTVVYAVEPSDAVRELAP